MSIDNLKDRTVLKDYFKANKIPTESHFSELIDGMLNQVDDGIKKPQNQPLRIAGEGGQLKTVLDICENISDSPKWSLRLKSKSSVEEKAGFSIHGKGGENRFFIDEDTGNVGIGVSDPNRKLTINGSIGFSDGNSPLMYIYSDQNSKNKRGVFVHSQALKHVGLHFNGDKNELVFQGESGASVIINLARSQSKVESRLSVLGSLSVNGGISLSRSLAVGSSLSIGGSLTTGKDLSVGKNISASGEVFVGSLSVVKGGASITGGIRMLGTQGLTIPKSGMGIVGGKVTVSALFKFTNNIVQNSWRKIGLGKDAKSGSLEYFLDSVGIAHFRGTVHMNIGKSWKNVAKLPKSILPKKQINYMVYGKGKNYGAINIILYMNGLLNISSTTEWATFDGLSYPTT